MLVSSFPIWTETFILNQIAGLIDRGNEVHIYARARNNFNTNHEIINKYKMMEHVFFANDYHNSASMMPRFNKAISLLLHNFNYLRPKFWTIAWKTISKRDRPEGWSRLSLLNLAVLVISRGDYDIIHCQFGNLGPIAIYLREIGAIKGKIITAFRGHDATQHSKVNSGMYRRLFQEGGLFLPVSEDLKKRLIDMGCPENRIRVHHSGIDCTKFKLIERKLEKDESTHILSVARLVEMKGLNYSIQAVAKLIKSGHNLTYTIVGDGALRSDLEQLIKSLGVEKHIHLLGWMDHDNVTLKLQTAHILIVPSITASRGETEGIPNIAKEAMAMGIPVLSTSSGGTPELVEDGESGFIVPERDIDALADRLEYLCDHVELWAKMGRAGRRKIEAEFDIDKLNDQLVKLYLD